MTATVDIHTTDEKGQQVLVYHGNTLSLRAALRVVDRFAPAPVNPYVRQRIHAEHGGQVHIGMVQADIGVYA
jgi:hypothetical protein